MLDDILPKANRVIKLVEDYARTDNKHGEPLKSWDRDLKEDDLDIIKINTHIMKLRSYLESLSEEEVYAILTIMYVGREWTDGRKGLTPKEVFECQRKELVCVSKDAEISQILSKVPHAGHYLKKGLNVLSLK